MTDFKPLTLPEESPPPHATQCQLCELSKQRQRVIWGEGNPKAPIFIILDNPVRRRPVLAKYSVEDLKLVSERIKGNGNRSQTKK